MQPDDRIRPVRLINDLLKAIVGDDIQAVHGCRAGVSAVRQAEPAADRLFDQGPCVGGPKGDNGVEIGHVPALFEHVDVDHHLRRLVGAFHCKEALHHLILLRAGLARINLNNLALVPALKKLVRADQVKQLSGMRRVTRNDEQERLHCALGSLPHVGLQLHLHVLVQTDAILQFDLSWAFPEVLRRVEAVCEFARSEFPPAGSAR